MNQNVLCPSKRTAKGYTLREAVETAVGEGRGFPRPALLGSTHPLFSFWEQVLEIPLPLRK